MVPILHKENIFQKHRQRNNFPANSMRPVLVKRGRSLVSILCDSWTVAHQAPPSMGFSRQGRSNPGLLHCRQTFYRLSTDKESACDAGALGSIPGLGRSPGEGKGYPFQYSGLENSMDCIVHKVTKSQT